VALCYGVAWSILQGLALPGPRFAKIAWIAALLPTGFIMVVMAKTLTSLLQQASALSPDDSWVTSLQAHYLPGIAGWVTLSLAGGAVMYWNLRRRPEAGSSQFYAQFD
jgi:ABC-type xylose transport system permease subunit